eukprot:8511155-Lingulodinium_polyedra.AAC.1
MPSEAHAIADAAPIEFQAEWGEDGKYTLDAAERAILVVPVVRDLANPPVDSHPLEETLAGGRQRHLALNVAAVIRDLPCNPIIAGDLPGLLDVDLNGSEQGVVRALTDR